MFPTGSKLLIGAATLATVAAIVYGTAQGGSLGTVGLIFAAACLAGLAGVNIYTRDGDVSAMDSAALTESAAARPTPPNSIWPMVGALGGILVVVGLVTYPTVFIFGIIALLGATVEWMIEAWSDRASADLQHNAEVRGRIAHPWSCRCWRWSASPSSSTRSAGSCCGSPRRVDRRCSGSSVRWSCSSGSSSPSGRRSATGRSVPCARSPPSASSPAAPPRRWRASARCIPTRPPARSAADGKCDDTAETEADEHSSQNVAAKANITAELIAPRGRHAHGQGAGRHRRAVDAHRHPGQPDERHLPQREQRAPSPRARPRHPPGRRRGHR